MIDLYRHLWATGTLRPYLRHLLWRQRRLLAYAMMAVAITFAVYEVNHQSIKRERDALFVACKRVQILRDQTNGLTLLAYDAWNNGAQREFSLVKKDPSRAQAHRTSARQLEVIAHSMVITGPTNCNAATDHPIDYRAPAPEFIFKNGPHIKLIRSRSANIVHKAATGMPLFTGSENG